MQKLHDLGFLNGKHTVFDYGCGRGDDVRLLRNMGIQATGWDPVLKPDERRRNADVVNLGFVLNVIEDAAERRDTLKSAFLLTRKVLIVSVMLGHQSRRGQFVEYGDGVRTRRNTFQKYFAQDEFRAYLQTTLASNAIPVAPGVCLVFRDPGDEQLFLLARQQVRREWRLLRSQSAHGAVAHVMDTHRVPIEAYWRKTLELGRPPAANECPPAQPLADLIGSWRRVHNWVSRFYSDVELEAAEECRREDLLVYFALSLFERKKPYSKLPHRIQNDIRFFFGSTAKARAAGKQALFEAGDKARIEKAAIFCHEDLGIGRLFERHHLMFHQSVLPRCPPLIRIYVGCGLQLFGDALSTDLIKVHLQSHKLTFLVYDDFTGSKHPKLRERIKVDLPRLRVDFFDHTSGADGQLLEGEASSYYQRR